MIVNEPVPDTFEDTPVKDRDPDWFKRAVFYEVLVRAFQDSNGDGVGDLKGLTAKLDYLQWLGVDCLWLPPFYDSPLRDGGYDIRDFYRVLPEFGTVDDFVALLDAAHKRGIRIITDLVMPRRLNGRALVDEILREAPDAKFVLTSGYSAELQEHGVNAAHFIAKPVPMNRLLDVVRQALDQSAKS